MIATQPLLLMLGWMMCITSSLAIAQESQLRSISTPFRASNFCVDPAESYAVVWNLVEAEADRDVGSAHSYPFNKTPRLAVIELATAKVLVDKPVAAPIIHAEATDKYVVVYPWATGRSRLDVLALPDLKLRRCWRFNNSIESFDIDDSRALVNVGGRLEILSTTSFGWLRRWQPTDRNHVWYRAARGSYFIDGAVLNENLKPQCLLHVGFAPVLPLFVGQEKRSPHDVAAHVNDLGYGPAWAEFVNTNGGRDPALLSRRDKQRLTGLPVREYEHPVVRTVGDTAYVLDSNKILIWTRPEPASSQIRFATKQTALVLGEGGVTELEHEIAGGKPPYRFSTEGAKELGYSIDPADGTITLDNAIIKERARALAHTRLLGTASSRVNNSGATRRLQELRSRTRNLVAATIPDANKVFAIAAPVHIEASDAEDQTASIRYYIWVTLPLKELHEHAESLDVAANERTAADEDATPEARKRLGEASQLVLKLRAELLKRQRKERAGK